MKKKIIVGFVSFILLIPTMAVVLYEANNYNSFSVSSVSFPAVGVLGNCVWLLPSLEGLHLLDEPSLWRSTALRLETANISCIIVWAGWWNADHTIRYADDPAVWNHFISTVKAVNSNFTVLALVGIGDGIDISDPSYRATMIDSVKQLLLSAPFDGWNDDLESFNGSNSDLIAYWQGVASMVKSNGGIATVDLGVDWSYTIEDVYPSLTNFNYIMPMFYGTIASANAGDYWNRILANSPVPIIMGLDVNPEENGNVAFKTQLSWVEGQSHVNISGYSVWAYDYWSGQDFNTWLNSGIKSI